MSLEYLNPLVKRNQGSLRFFHTHTNISVVDQPFQFIVTIIIITPKFCQEKQGL